MSDRIRRIREELYERLKANGIHWDHILKQRGMFSFTGLTGEWGNERRRGVGMR